MGIILQKYKYLILLAAVVLGGAVFRFYGLHETPPGLWVDEAMNGTNALEAIETGNYKLFYPENNGREGLWMNIISLSVRVFGTTPFAIRVCSAIVGSLTVLGIFLLAHECMRKYKEHSAEAAMIIALLSSFFLATSYWHINFSRIGFRAILVPFVTIFAFYFLFRGERTTKLIDFVVSGFFFGVGFHTYIAYRVTPAIILVYMCLVLLNYWLRSRPLKGTPLVDIYKKSGAYRYDILLAVMILVALPIGIYFLQNPQDFAGRTGQVSVLSSGSPITTLLKNIGLSLSMYLFHGDCNWRHNLPCRPELYAPVALFFVIGFAISLKKILADSKNFFLSVRNKIAGFEFSIVDWTLMAWFWVMLLPSVFSMEGLPHSLRSIGTIPPAFIFAGMGAYALYHAMRNIFIKRNIKETIPPKIIAGLALLLIAYYPAQAYFVDWADNPTTKSQFTQNLVDTGDYLIANTNDPHKVYIIANQTDVLVHGLPVAVQVIEYITYRKIPPPAYLLPDQLAKIDGASPSRIIMMQFDENIRKELEQRFGSRISFRLINNIMIGEL
jgi:hypothetical protein